MAGRHAGAGAGAPNGAGNEAGRSAGTARRVTASLADRFQVVLHVDAEALRAESPGAELPRPEALREEALREGTLCEGAVRQERGHTPSDPAPSSGSGAAVLERGGLGVSAETSRRIACDASGVNMTHGADGSVLDVGRRSRTVPPAIRRALDHRDRGCRFPGCGLRFCDAHHIRHWADGGETRLGNLFLVCRHHHRALHEGGFRVEVAETGELRFYRPDGRLVPDVPAAPPLPKDPVASLKKEHRALGIEPDAWTATPDWHGEPLDLGLAIYALRPA